METPCCIILAAGKGTRMGTDLPKVAQKLLMKPMIAWVADAAKNAGVTELCAVVGYKSDIVEHSLTKGAFFAYQEEQLGTGHAVSCALEFLKASEAKRCIVISGDTPLISPQTIRELCDTHQSEKNSVTVASAVVDNPFGYGRILKKGASLLKIVEQKDADEETQKITEINSGIYCFDKESLIFALSKLKPNNSQKEYYLTDTIGILVAEGKKAGVFTVWDKDEILGVNSLSELYIAQEKAKEKLYRKLFEDGVFIADQNSCLISPDAKIGRGTVILPSTIICGDSIIGENCEIGPNAYLENTVIHDAVRFNASQAYDSEVGESSKIGPFAYLRPKTKVGKNVKIGDFVETKNAKIGDNTKISHLSYMGDTIIGSHVNIGCGTITVNYDGKGKFLTEIGNHSFVGCNTNLIAPVKVNDNTYVAAGSTITDEVPEGALAIARAKQVNKNGWMKKREEKNK